eukprot:scaffold5937_cov275-Pinguiococcus_pyrenoidosus.AAC.9
MARFQNSFHRTLQISITESVNHNPSSEIGSAGSAARRGPYERMEQMRHVPEEGDGAVKDLSDLLGKILRIRLDDGRLVRTYAAELAWLRLLYRKKVFRLHCTCCNFAP